MSRLEYLLPVPLLLAAGCSGGLLRSDAEKPTGVLHRIRSGSAKPHGLVLLGGGTAGCLTYREETDDNHRVYYLLRDGEYSGEYRKEELDQGKFLRTEELFLTIASRGEVKRPAADELEYVLIETHSVWREGILDDTYKKYRLVRKDRKGNTIYEGDWKLERVIKDEITVNLDLPTGFDEDDLYLESLRTGMPLLESLVNHRFEDSGECVDRKKIDGRKCTIKIAYSTVEPEVTLSLVRKLTIPRDACPFIFRKKVLKTETIQITGGAPDTHVLRCE